MKLKPSKFQVYKESSRDFNYWANYLDENVLLRTFPHAKPWIDLTDPVMNYLAASNPGLIKKTSIYDSLVSSNSVRIVDDEYIKWSLKGTGETSTMATKNLHPGNSTVGIGNSLFQHSFDRQRFVTGDIIAPEVAKDISVVVQSHAHALGDGWVHDLQLSDKNPYAFFPAELLEPNLKWIKLGAAYSERSSGYGSMDYQGTSMIQFQTELTSWGKTVEVTDKAHNMHLRVSAVDAQGKPMKQFPDQVISMVEAEFIAQGKWEKELTILYGRSAGRTVIDETTGLHRRIGPGVYEFMEDGNVIDYPLYGFSIDMFEQYLQAVWLDRVPYDQRNVKVYTGLGGIKQFSDAALKKGLTIPAQIPYSEYVEKGPSFGNGNSIAFKNQIVMKWNLAMFGSVELVHLPILDDMYLHGSVLHPETGLPLESYKYLIMDYGLGESSNIELLKKRDSEVFTYTCGVWSPAGPLNTKTGRSGFVSSHGGRYYQLFAADTFGVRLKDVTLTAMFCPAVTY